MVNPVAAAIRAKAMAHARNAGDCGAQLRALKRLYVETDRQFQAMIRELEERMRDEREAARDAVSAAREARGL